MRYVLVKVEAFISAAGGQVASERSGYAAHAAGDVEEMIGRPQAAQLHEVFKLV